MVKANIVKLIPLRTHKIVADALTKSLPLPAFISHRKVMLGQVPFSLKCLVPDTLQSLHIKIYIYIHEFYMNYMKEISEG